MSTIPDFGSVDLGRPASSASKDDWAKAKLEKSSRHQETWWHSPTAR